MTLPTLTHNIQQQVLKVQFKKTYSMLNEAMVNTQTNLGYIPECYLWETRPHGGYHFIYDENGNALYWVWNDGTTASEDPYADGHTSECPIFSKAFFENFKQIKYCDKNAYEKGCIPPYKGQDKFLQEANPAMSEADMKKQGSDGDFSTERLRNNYSAAVLANGMIIMQQHDWWPVFLVDINGKNKPNLLGYDVFAFAVKGNNTSFVRLKDGWSNIAKGGKSTAQMLIDSFK